MPITPEDGADVRDGLLASIDASARGKSTIKIKSLLERFGFAATQRVRQTSLASVQEQLAEWGIGVKFVGARSDDSAIVWRSRAPLHTPPPPAPSGREMFRRLGTVRDPFNVVFRVDDETDQARSAGTVFDILGSIWATRPVCLLIDAPDEFFTFAVGYFATVLRRRALSVRSEERASTIQRAPTVLTIADLKRVTGQLGDHDVEFFPSVGAVYIVRDDPNDPQDDELTALVRECFIPHTHRVRTEIGSTSAAAAGSASGPRLFDLPSLAGVLRWLACLAGSQSVIDVEAVGEASVEVQLTSMLVDANRTRDILLDRGALRETDSAMKSGFESAEHRTLKGLIVAYLRAANPTARIEVEGSVELPADQDDETTSAAESELGIVRPDIRIGDEIWVEIETLRGLALGPSAPFGVLEEKLRRKAGAMRRSKEVWLLLPSDALAFAEPQILAVARSVSAAIGNGAETIVRAGFVDLADGVPTFVEPSVAERPVLRVKGVAWRAGSRTAPTRPPKRLADVAGYRDLKKRVDEEILHPLTHPELYGALGVANGLLLYGLPGCGKSLLGEALAGEADLPCRRVLPSDFSGPYLGQGTEKIREIFDWTLRQQSCVLIIDEVDGSAPQRSEGNMHSDEKRQVNELLAQLDRLQGTRVVVVATTNYIRGVDAAIRRSGRFDFRIPVFPPDEGDRLAILDYYLSAPRIPDDLDASGIDRAEIARRTRLYTPSDLKTAVLRAARAARRLGSASIGMDTLLDAVSTQARSIQPDDAATWIEEAKLELSKGDEQLAWLEREVKDVFL